MAQAIPYPDITSDKFTGTEQSEDPEVFMDLITHKIQFSLGQQPNPDDHAEEAQLWNQRRTALFASLLRGPASEWFQNLPQAIRDDFGALRNQFIERFTDNRTPYRYRIDAENCKRGDFEQIKSYIHRVTRIVQKGWPTLNNAQASQKAIEIFTRGLMPLSLKQSAHKFLIGHENVDFDVLSNHILEKDLTFTMSATLSGTAPEGSGGKLESLEKQVSELTELMKEHKINTFQQPRGFNPNNPRMKQNVTRFCKYCRRSGHTIAFCRTKKANDFQRQRSRQPPPPKAAFQKEYRRQSPYRRPYRGSVPRFSNPHWQPRFPGPSRSWPNSENEDDISKNMAKAKRLSNLGAMKMLEDQQRQRFSGRSPSPNFGSSRVRFIDENDISAIDNVTAEMPLN